LQREEEVVLEMQNVHNQQLREQKLRQSIHENSPEIRELEKKLNHAYTNKERSIQLKEKKLATQAEKVGKLN
jgi:Trichohyalin-plectin-homology domain